MRFAILRPHPPGLFFAPKPEGVQYPKTLSRRSLAFISQACRSSSLLGAASRLSLSSSASRHLSPSSNRSLMARTTYFTLDANPNATIAFGSFLGRIVSRWRKHRSIFIGASTGALTPRKRGASAALLVPPPVPFFVPFPPSSAKLAHRQARHRVQAGQPPRCMPQSSRRRGRVHGGGEGRTRLPKP